MFTGIVESVGNVVGAVERGDLLCLSIDAPAFARETGIGDSIAINGACLTITASEGSILSFEAIRETGQRTNLGDLTQGSRVNLERAMRAGGRLDGHIVQGHVDGVGSVDRLQREGEDVRLFVSCGPDVAEYLVPKGSVAIDGVSLTVVDARRDGFDVALIPHTLKETTLGDLRPGDRVNLEADVLGKYVKRYLERVVPGGDARTSD